MDTLVPIYVVEWKTILVLVAIVLVVHVHVATQIAAKARHKND